jgi:hypothetical protein
MKWLNLIVLGFVVADNSLRLSDRDTCTPTDILIINTIDGALHGINKVTGHVLWSLTDSWGPIVKVQDSEQTQLSHVSDGVYIPEPGGDLYHFIPGQPIKVPYF